MLFSPVFMHVQKRDRFPRDQLILMHFVVAEMHHSNITSTAKIHKLLLCLFMLSVLGQGRWGSKAEKSQNPARPLQCFGTELLVQRDYWHTCSLFETFAMF